MRSWTFILVLSVVLIGGCESRNQLIVMYEGDASVIVQPEQPLPYDPECPLCDYHRAVLLDRDHRDAFDLYAEPGSLVRVFDENCGLLGSFTFAQAGGFGQTAFEIDSAGQVSSTKQFDVMGDGAAGSVEHAICAIS
jgi:hypothetical protein